MVGNAESGAVNGLKLNGRCRECDVGEGRQVPQRSTTKPIPGVIISPHWKVQPVNAPAQVAREQLEAGRPMESDRECLANSNPVWTQLFY